MSATRDRVFRDPVHGLIEFKDDARPLQTLLDTRPFQRLRRIRQLGFAWLVYPGAEHSRFGHALGAYHVARRIAQRLQLDAEIGRDVVVAALLHDIGHGPFSHAWESALGTDHEAWGARIAAEEPELAGALAAIDGALPAALARFYDKTYRPSFARKLVSSQLDCDRLDYLLRDGHYSGAGYATYDLDWILHALRIEQVEGDRNLVVDYRRGMFAVEQYLFARSYMYAQVYHHKTVRAAEWMFLELLRRFAELARTGDEPPGLAPAGKLARGEPITVDEYLWLDDISVFTAIDRWAGRGLDEPARDPVLRDLARRMVSRTLFKSVELGDDPGVVAAVEDRARAIAERSFGADAGYYWAIDTARQIGYERGEEELHVVGHPRHGTVTLGQLLAGMPLGRPMSTIRIVCAPELAGDLRTLAQSTLAG